MDLLKPNWQESIASNRDAAIAAHANQWTGEELHATDYLTYASLQGAWDEEARRILERLPQFAEVQLSRTDS